MNDNLLLSLVIHQRSIRFFTFFFVFILMTFLERKDPRRKESIPRILRWPNNLALGFFNHFFFRILWSGSAFGAVHLALHFHFGLFQWVKVPPTFLICFSVVVLDWANYYQHRALHAIPVFWKIHRMHHTDLEMDVSTGTRFHTFEVFISLVIKSFVILLLGAPLTAFLVYEFILNSMNLFDHSNIRIPLFLEKVLRTVLVTPEFHRIHHSILPIETNSNFGIIFSFWDRIFKTYRFQPQEGQENMKLGLDFLRDSKYLGLWELFKTPFLDRNGHFDWGNLTKTK